MRYGETDPEAPLRVVVYSEGGRGVGLVVDAILDTVEETITARSDLEAAGVLGSAVVQAQDHRAARRAVRRSSRPTRTSTPAP